MPRHDPVAAVSEWVEGRGAMVATAASSYGPTSCIAEEAMSTATPPRKWSGLYIAMTVLIGIVIASIVVQIVLELTNHPELARVVNPFTFAMLSGFFLIFGVYSGMKGKPT